MKAVVLLKLAGRSIGRNTMRTALTTLGILIGVASVTVMVAVGQGAQQQVHRQIGSLGTNLIVVVPGNVSQGGVSQGAGTFSRLTLEDVEAIDLNGTLLAAVSPVVMTRTQVIGPAGNWRTSVQGVDADYEKIRDWAVQDGAFFTAEDVFARRKVALLGKTVADALFPGESPVGRRIQVRDTLLDVMGVLAPKGQMSSGQDQDDVVLIPYTTAQARLSGQVRIPQILVSATSVDDLPAAQEEVRAALRDSHAIAPGDEDDFTVRDQTQIAEAAAGATRIMTMLLAAIASISLLVGGIGVMNIMLVSVTERTREIGIRMAIGARDSDVMVQFLVESVVLSLLGGLAGAATGIGGAALLAHFTGWTVSVPPATIALALGFSGAIGVFFGFQPARKAAGLNPIQALRYE
jgi:putative ABC transport system permease protein